MKAGDESGINLSVRNVSVSYFRDAEDIQVIQDFSLDVKSGEIVSICGASGVGKSTLVRTIAGLVKPSAGTIEIESVKVNEPIENLGFVTQDYSRSLFPWLTVGKNVELPFKGKGITKEERESRINKVLEEVALIDVAHRYPWQLSGGMQQRVAIARALVMRPKLLILDEPFASIDVFVRLELEDLVLNLVRNHHTTTLLVTHDIDEAIYMGDRVVVLGGAPASLTLNLDINLDWPRSQLETRSDKRFLELRRQLHGSIRS
jgi:NitT/TauT family transport system ATP-binding protein